MTQMYSFFDRKLFFLFCLMVTMLTVMVFLGPKEILDNRLYYTGEEARLFFSNLSLENREGYKILALIDLAFIVVYTATLKRSLRISFGLSFSLLGLLPGLFDLIETSEILRCLWTGEISSLLDVLGFFTFLKWTSGFALLFILFVAPKRFRRQSSRRI